MTVGKCAIDLCDTPQKVGDRRSANGTWTRATKRSNPLQDLPRRGQSKSACPRGTQSSAQRTDESLDEVSIHGTVAAIERSPAAPQQWMCLSTALPVRYLPGPHGYADSVVACVPDAGSPRVRSGQRVVTSLHHA